MSASPPLVFADIDLTLCIFFALFLPQETAIDKIGRISSEVDSLLEDLSVSEPRTDEERSVSDQLQAMVQELREKTNSAKLTCLGDPEGLTKLREDIGKEVAEAAAATVRTDASRGGGEDGKGKEKGSDVEGDREAPGITYELFLDRPGSSLSGSDSFLAELEKRLAVIEGGSPLAAYLRSDVIRFIRRKGLSSRACLSPPSY